MPLEVELKLQDLVKIALGSPNLTNVNIAILHSLMDILLKKLNCQNETVFLGAFESKQLGTMLENSKISPLAFNDENIELISSKLERLQKLEDKVNTLDSKLNKHIEESDKERLDSAVQNSIFNWDTWDSYGCEDVCTICDPDNDFACKLLKDSDFLKKLLRRISAPMVNRTIYLERKIEKLHKEFFDFIQRTEEEYFKIELLKKCIEEVGTLRLKVSENHRLFLVTMEEIQDLLDAKLDKFHMPGLKKYIRDNYRDMEQSINAIKAMKHCPKVSGMIMDGVRCLSCGNAKVCGEVGVQPAAMLPEMKGAQNLKQKLKYCGCPYQKYTQSTANSIKLNDVTVVPQSKYTRDSEDDPPKCRKDGEEFALMEGFDGNLYRKG